MEVDCYITVYITFYTRFRVKDSGSLSVIYPSFYNLRYVQCGSIVMVHCIPSTVYIHLCIRKETLKVVSFLTTPGSLSLPFQILFATLYSIRNSVLTLSVFVLSSLVRPDIVVFNIFTLILPLIYTVSHVSVCQFFLLPNIKQKKRQRLLDSILWEGSNYHRHSLSFLRVQTLSTMI